jgi:hypothetical protein
MIDESIASALSDLPGSSGGLVGAALTDFGHNGLCQAVGGDEFRSATVEEGEARAARGIDGSHLRQIDAEDCFLLAGCGTLPTLFQHLHVLSCQPPFELENQGEFFVVDCDSEHCNFLLLTSRV